MRLGELLHGVDIVSCAADLSAEITDVCFDSRMVNEKSVYVASKRPNADGHDYINAAISAGAAVIISEKIVPNYPNVVVKNGCFALAVMSGNLYGNPAERMTIIGVTGTKGKTTTAYMIKYMLEKTVKAKVGLIGTVCNMAGEEILENAKNTTPEAPQLQALLSQMEKKGCTHVVMEVSSHALAFDRLTNIRFNVGIFNNFSQDHLDFHGTMENYLKSKSILFDISDLGAVNIDDPASEYIMENTWAKKLTFGICNESAMLRGENVKLLGGDGVSFTVEDVSFTLPIPGMFTVYNAMSTISCAKLLGIDLSLAAKALSSMHGVPGRIESIPCEKPFNVIVDYAHSPDSMEKVLEAVKEFTKGKIISVFGCGGNRDRTKRPKMAQAAAKYSDYVVVTTDNPRFEEPMEIIKEILPGICDSRCPYEVLVDREAAIGKAISLAECGDTVLIMGKGHENYQEIQGVRHHFDDREIARKYLETESKR